jgi:hypothetical protein
MFYIVIAVAPANCLVIIKLSITRKWQLPLLTPEKSIAYIDRIDRKIEKLYLPTLTLSTEADFHSGRVRRKSQ